MYRVEATDLILLDDMRWTNQTRLNFFLVNLYTFSKFSFLQDFRIFKINLNSYICSFVFVICNGL